MNSASASPRITQAYPYFLLVPPGWDGVVPDGFTLIRFPTTVASIVGRWSVAGDDDLPSVHALQDATTLTPWTPDRPGQGSPYPTLPPGERATLAAGLRAGEDGPRGGVLR